jgi:hypothetical protein
LAAKKNSWIWVKYESGLSHMGEVAGGTPYGARYQGQHVTAIAGKLFR